MKISERNIQNWLFRKLASSCSIIMPNFTPVSWFEVDLFAVTKAGFFHEYEIKLTASDFRADAEKSEILWRTRPATKRTKYSRLAQADVQGPSCFWYVLPLGLIHSSEVPDWAGIKVVEDFGSWLNIKTIRQAPRLHQEKIDQKVIETAQRNVYYRFWQERIRNGNQANK